MKNKNCHGGNTGMLPVGASDEVKQNVKNFWDKITEEKTKDEEKNNQLK